MQFLLPHSVSVADNRKKVYLDLLQKLGPGTKSPRPLTKNFPNSYGDILSDIMFIVYVCEGTDFPYTFHLVQFTVSPLISHCVWCYISMLSLHLYEPGVNMC